MALVPGGSFKVVGIWQKIGPKKLKETNNGCKTRVLGWFEHANKIQVWILQSKAFPIPPFWSPQLTDSLQVHASWKALPFILGSILYTQPCPTSRKWSRCRISSISCFAGSKIPVRIEESLASLDCVWLFAWSHRVLVGGFNPSEKYYFVKDVYFFWRNTNRIKEIISEVLESLRMEKKQNKTSLRRSQPPKHFKMHLTSRCAATASNIFLREDLDATWYWWFDVSWWCRWRLCWCWWVGSSAVVLVGLLVLLVSPAVRGLSKRNTVWWHFWKHSKICRNILPVPLPCHPFDLTGRCRHRHARWSLSNFSSTGLKLEDC